MDQAGMKVVDLKPGEVHVANEPTLIMTLLGSCVSVCLFNADYGVGAMSHSILPSPANRLLVDEMRYVEPAIMKMLADLSRMGVRRERITAKLFGGAEMLAAPGNMTNMRRLVGDSNTQAARRFLDREGVKIISECVGGTAGRKLIFNTSTGVVLVRKVGTRLASPVAQAFGGIKL